MVETLPCYFFGKVQSFFRNTSLGCRRVLVFIEFWGVVRAHGMNDTSEGEPSSCGRMLPLRAERWIALLYSVLMMGLTYSRHCGWGRIATTILILYWR